MKIAIIGGGNAGVWTALHYAYYAHKNIEIELIHDECGKSVEVIYQCGSCKEHVPRSRVRLEQPRAS